MRRRPVSFPLVLKFVLGLQHEDGRVYFVREGDAGPGSWTKPADLLDIPEYLSGTLSTSGSPSLLVLSSQNLR
jgi:hypothetical protein